MGNALVDRIHDLARAARLLALIGAWMKLQSTDAADDTVRGQVERGLEAALGETAGALRCANPAELLAVIEMALVESGDIFHNIGRPPGWKVVDETALAAMGRASSSAFDRILALAVARPALAASFSGRFLDVGTGVGGIALRAAETCPGLAVEAIDIWAPALRLARQRIATSPHRDRIALRELDVARLSPPTRFTFAWLPTMFLSRAAVRDAIDRIASASCRGAWLVASVYTIPADPFAAVVAKLRTRRSGGEITDPAVLADLLGARGYVDVEVDTAPVATFVFGRLP